MASINKRLKVKIVIRICTYCQIFSSQYSISVELIDSSFLDKYIKQMLVNLRAQSIYIMEGRSLSRDKKEVVHLVGA